MTNQRIKIADILKSKKVSLSFEVFPPKKKEALDSIKETALSLTELKPDFISVTFGAGGTTKGYTADIAEATGLPVRSINGIITAAFQRKGLMERVEKEVELEDGNHAKVKFIKLTDEGKKFNPDAEDAE